MERHMKETGKLAKNFGLYLNLKEEEIDLLFLAGKMHDIGKKMVDQNILNKAGSLTDEEYEKIKKHPLYTKKILEEKGYSEKVIKAAYQHHERIDGKGYPEGLNGNKISLFGKILALCDSYDAMTENRVYSKAKSREEAIEEIRRNLNTQFDNQIGTSFINFIKKGPY
jgi:HD-GYP domain-containing protein (c-di-GMP phosphodiesterase class II)